MIISCKNDQFATARLFPTCFDKVGNNKKTRGLVSSKILNQIVFNEEIYPPIYC